MEKSFILEPPIMQKSVKILILNCISYYKKSGFKFE